jgi:acetyl esterase/lipase
VFVHFHGGGMVIGNKNRESLPLLYHLASQGWVCISANYRLRDAARFTDHLIDVKKVIAWVRQHDTEYDANSETLILADTSSGGQLAALAGFTQNDRRFQPGFEREDTSVSGVVYLGGFYGFPGAAWSPLEADAADAPPFLIVHGKNDSVVPVEYARLLARKLRRESPSPVVSAELPGAQHAFDRFYTISFDTIVTAVESFAAWAAASRRPASRA